MNTRIKKTSAILSKISCGAVIIASPENIRYITGFYIDRSILLVETGGKGRFFSYGMNKSLGQKNIKDANITIEGGDIYKNLCTYVKGQRLRDVGFFPHEMTVAEYDLICRYAGKESLRVLDDFVRVMRSKKDEDEIDALRGAAKATVKIWRDVKKNIRVGMKEREVATLIDVLIRQSGFENSFDTIVASGPNSADPHAIPSGKKIRSGEHLLADFGIKYHQYCSDLTRIWEGGRISRNIRAIKEAVEYAQMAAFRDIKPGVRIAKPAARANKYFIDNGLGKYIYHGLGHGLGMEIHEAPSLTESAQGYFKKGMVVTVEPGLYIPGVGGYRIEDMVLLTSNGCEVLTR